MSEPTAVTSDNNAGPQLVIWGTDVVVSQCKTKFRQFIEEYTDVNIEADELMEHVDFERPFYLQKLEEVSYGFKIEEPRSQGIPLQFFLLLELISLSTDCGVK